MTLSDAFHCTHCGIEMHAGSEELNVVMDRHWAIAHQPNPVYDFFSGTARKR